jgi:hypothetical protein
MSAVRRISQIWRNASFLSDRHLSVHMKQLRAVDWILKIFFSSEAQRIDFRGLH